MSVWRSHTAPLNPPPQRLRCVGKSTSNSSDHLPADRLPLSTVKFSVAAVAAGMFAAPGSVTAEVIDAAGIATPATAGNLMRLSGEFSPRNRRHPLSSLQRAANRLILQHSHFCDKSGEATQVIFIICESRRSVGLSRALLSLHNSLT